MNHNFLLITQFWNESFIIPFFLKHYAPHCKKMIFVDYNSIDNSREFIMRYSNAEIVNLNLSDLADDTNLLYIKNDFRKTFRNKYDWFIVCDLDEFLYYPTGITELITDMKNNNCNIISPTGFQMVGDKFPALNKDLIQEINTGVTNDSYNFYNGKKILFSSEVDLTWYAGCHTVESEKTFRQFKNENLKLLHYKFIDIENLIKRKNETLKRMSKKNLELGWGIHNTWSDDLWREEFKKLKTESKKVI